MSGSHVAFMERPQLNWINPGHLIIALSAIHFVFASYAILFSAFLPLTGIYVRQMFVADGSSNLKSSGQVLDLVAKDTHYKYFVMLMIPMSIYFVIGNWVGWQYYRNS